MAASINSGPLVDPQILSKYLKDLSVQIPRNGGLILETSI